MEDSPAISRSLLDFGFDDDTLDEMTTCYATLNMFYELGLHSHFAIEKDVSFFKIHIIYDNLYKGAFKILHLPTFLQRKRCLTMLQKLKGYSLQ
jgi:hypothetical protein